MTVNLAPLIFLDCFSKQAHLGRPGRANPLDPSADQDRLNGKVMGGNPVFRGTRVPVHMLAELVPSPSGNACARVTGGEVARKDPGSFRCIPLVRSMLHRKRKKPLAGARSFPAVRHEPTNPNDGLARAGAPTGKGCRCLVASSRLVARC